MYRNEHCGGIWQTWKQIAELEAKRLEVESWNPGMARAIGRKILRRATVLAELVARDKASQD